MTMLKSGCIVTEIPLKVVPEFITSCEDCPYTIPCFSGHFSNDDVRMDRFSTYCPGCEVLRYQYLPEDVLMAAYPNEMLSIRCAVRNNEGFVRETIKGWDHERPLSVLPMLFETMWTGEIVITVADPGPGTFILVTPCSQCCKYNAQIESKRHLLERFAAEVRHKMWMKGE
jgi:hypothetical protein